jgi:hypothetical protein
MTGFFRRLLNGHGRKGASRRGSAPKPAARLNLEALDHRIVLTASVANFGGGIITHVQVEDVYYGQGWTSAANQQNAAQIDTFMSTIVGSDYMSMLGEYGVGKGKFAGRDMVDRASAPATGTSVNDYQIQYMLSQEILNNKAPKESGSQLYFVYLPPNVLSQNDTAKNAPPYGNVGHHTSFVIENGPIYETVYYAVITNPVGQFAVNWAAQNGLSNFQGQTEVTTHELSEAVTDPVVGKTWTGSSGEIGDLVNFQYVTFDGYTVQKEWSQFWGKGIAQTRDTPGSVSNPGAIRAGSIWNLGKQSNGETLEAGFDAGGHIYYKWVTAAGDDLGWFSDS